MRCIPSKEAVTIRTGPSVGSLDAAESSVARSATKPIIEQFI